MKKLIYLFIASLLISSCGVKDPADIVKEYYSTVVADDIVSAKEYCLPSAKEEIERLEKLDAFSKNVNKGEIEIMEVVKPPENLEGDTAIVNYKIGDYKNFLTLILTDKKWKIAFGYELKQILILKYSSFEFAEELLSNEDLFWENYKGIYFEINDLAILESTNPPQGIPYSKEKNMVYANNSGRSRSSSLSYTLFNNTVSINPDFKLGEYDPNRNINIYLNDLSVSDESSFKLAERTYVNDNFHYDMNCLATIRGRFCRYFSDNISFCNCKVIDIENQ